MIPRAECGRVIIVITYKISFAITNPIKNHNKNTLVYIICEVIEFSLK